MLLADTALLSLAGFLAFGLRYNLEFFHPAVTAAWLYHCAVILSAVCVIPIFGIERSIWRFNSVNDYLLAAIVSAVVVAAATLITLLISRFDGIGRSIPVIHFVLAAFMMVVARIAYRDFCCRRRIDRNAGGDGNLIELQRRRDVLVIVVGINRLAEAYIESVAEFASSRLRIVGVIGTEERHVGRLVATRPVLGVAEDIETVIKNLEPHGAIINRIVVAAETDTLSEAAIASLSNLEESGRCELQFLARELRIVEPNTISGEFPRGERSAGLAERDASLRFMFPNETMNDIARRSNALSKRCVDAIGAFFLLVLLSPLMVATTVALGLFIGSPVIFWQQRPGRRGIPFRLYKFRTMRPPYDESGRLLSDEERVSAVGNFLRRFRLDELPQLFNILIGDMSFVGPRPLLPRDQAPRDCARLLVRPGLTGWAQVVGGRDVSADDKAALDVWYVKNASLLLDLRIAIRTIPVILFGESIHRSTIAEVWHELRRDGILNG